MGKAIESWRGMQNFLEQDMLAECLKGRVRWDCIEFPGLESATAFEVYVDDVLAKRFSMERVACVVCGPKKPGEKRDMKKLRENKKLLVQCWEQMYEEHKFPERGNA